MDATFNLNMQAQIDALNHEARQCRTSNLLTSITLAQEALALSEDKINFPDGYLNGIVNGHYNLSYVYLTLSKLEDALQHALAAVSFSTEGDNQKQLASSHKITGYCYNQLGNYPKALTHFQLVISAGKKLNDPLIKAGGYRGLGEVYGDIGEQQKAIHYTTMGLTIFQALADRAGQQRCLNNLCWLNNASGLYAQALQCGLESLSLCKIKNGDYSRKIIMSNLGQSYLGLKDSVRAHYYLDLAQAIKGSASYYTLSLLLADKGAVYILEGNLIAAEQVLTEALHLSIKSENPHCEYLVHQKLSELHKLAGNFETALFHSEQHRIIHNSYMGEENARHTRYLEIAFNTESAERESTFFRTRNKELTLRVSERTRELEVLTAELERAYQQETALGELKSRIISTVSHEFRAPLTIINSSIDNLDEGYEHLSNATRHTTHQRAQEAILYLTDLLQDIDLVDTVEHKKIRPNFETRPFNTTITQIVTELQTALATPQHLSFQYDATCTVLISADSLMLKQVIHTLLSNSLRYSAENSPIHITITHDPNLSLILRDEGIGIPTADINKIWQLFYRGSNIGQRQGLGLGLFIAQGLIKAMNGTIHVQSVENVGTTFTLTFHNSIIS